MKKIFTVIMALCAFSASHAQFRFNAQHPDAHDPVMAKGEDGRFYVFTTGFNVGVASMLSDYAPETAGCANAFLVEDANAPHQMLRRLKDALHVYRNEVADWDKAVVNAYSGFHYEWARTISKYLLILGELGL